MSVRTGAARAPALPPNARSRLDAVLAAGMARMSLLKKKVVVAPTDMPFKRGREYAGADDLDVLLNNQEEEIPDSLLDALLERAREEPAVPVPLVSNDEIQDALAQLQAGEEEEEQEGEDDANALVDGFMAEVPNVDHSPLPLLPGTDPSKVPSWIPRQMAPYPPILLPEHKSAVTPGVARYFTRAEQLYLFWYVMHPYVYNKWMPTVWLELQITKEQSEDRFKSMKRMLTHAGVATPKRPPVWYTVPNALLSYPPTLLPEQSSANHPPGQDRKFTDEETAYLYWYLFHPEVLKTNLAKVKADLHLGQVELQDKSKSLRYRVKQYFKVDVPPSPFKDAQMTHLIPQTPAHAVDPPLTLPQRVAVEGLVAIWDQRAAQGLHTTLVMKDQALKELSKELWLSAERLYRYLAAHHKRHARPRDLAPM